MKSPWASTYLETKGLLTEKPDRLEQCPNGLQRIEFTVSRIGFIAANFDPILGGRINFSLRIKPSNLDFYLFENKTPFNTHQTRFTVANYDLVPGKRFI